MSGASNSFSSKPVAEHKWGIKYDGKSNALFFLKKVNDLMVARSISEDELFNSAYDLFQDPALTWYRSVRNSVYDWYSLVELLKKVFLPSDCDEKLLDDIKVRHQRRDEPIVIYIAEMNTFFNRLSDVLPEESRQW